MVLHDEIDLPFGEVRSKLGGGLAGHNGLKSLGGGLGGPDFWRVRSGVGRPDSTDPEIVSAHVLGRFSEPKDDVIALVQASADEAERLIERIASGRTRSGGAGLMPNPVTATRSTRPGSPSFASSARRPATR